MPVTMDCLRLGTRHPAGFQAVRAFGGDPAGGLMRMRMGRLWGGRFRKICLSHQVAQLARAEGSRIEVGGQVGKPFSNFS